MIRFVQKHATCDLVFEGEIAFVDQFYREPVYHVMINFTDGTLYALVREHQITGERECLLSNPR